MKHRSVIAFVIIAAALFAAPQLSHDLQALKSVVGSRLRGELLQAFLNLHPDDSGAAASPRQAQTLFASCTKEKPAAPAAKSRKNEPRASAEPQDDSPAAEGARAQLASLTEPADAPEAPSAQVVPARFEVFVGEAAAAGRRVPAEGEVAMIIPPDSGIDPRAFADLRVAESKARESAEQRRKATEELRRVAYVAARAEMSQAEWQRSGEEALRQMSETLPGAFELRTGRDGAKVKTIKVIKRNDGAMRPASVVPAPRAPRVPGQVACLLPAPPAAPVGE